MFDLIHLAFQTDSTRLVTLMLLGTSSVPPIQGVPRAITTCPTTARIRRRSTQLSKVELEKIKSGADFLAKLQQTKEDGGTLLDRTMVFFGSNLGNASTHDR